MSLFTDELISALARAETRISALERLERRARSLVFALVDELEQEDADKDYCLKLVDKFIDEVGWPGD